MRLFKLILFFLICVSALSACNDSHQKDFSISTSQRSYFASNELDEIDMGVASGILSEMDEPSFLVKAEPHSARYRFLWYPYLMRTPLVIRIDVDENANATIYSKLGNGPPSYEIELMGYSEMGVDLPPSKLIHNANSKLPHSDFVKVSEMFDEIDICKPSNNQIGMDGAMWLFEYESNGKVCVLDLWSPGEPKFKTLAKYMIELGGMDSAQFIVP